MLEIYNVRSKFTTQKRILQQDPNANKEKDQNDQVIPESFYWAETKGSDFTKMIDDIYGCIVF